MVERFLAYHALAIVKIPSIVHMDKRTSDIQQFHIKIKYIILSTFPLHTRHSSSLNLHTVVLHRPLDDNFRFRHSSLRQRNSPQRRFQYEPFTVCIQKSSCAGLVQRI